MPNRIIKESICTSDNIEALSLEAETFFYRLLVRCDDFGRFDARPTVLRSSCFPLRVDRVTDPMITEWMDELIAADLIQEYEIDGHPYLQVKKWDKHQQIRAKRSKYPEMIASDSNGNQLRANVPVIQSNPIQSESNNGAEEPRRVSGRPEERSILEAFCEESGIPEPQPTSEKEKKSAAALWYQPIRRMARLADGRGPDLARQAVRQLRRANLTVANPASIEKTVTSLFGKSKSKSETPEL